MLNWIGRGLFALTLTLAGGVAAESMDDGHWVATWTTSPLPASDQMFGEAPSFEDVTLRQILHTSVGGEAIRVRVTNVFGADDLQLGGAHVVLQSDGAAIVAGSGQALTFSGNESITIPAGATVMSDPVAMDVPAFTNLAIDLYFPGDTGPATLHSTAVQTSYVSTAGGHAGAEDFPVASELNISAFLAGVEVVADEETGVIVTFGDSITDGAGSTPNANARWPNFLARRLAEAGTPFAVANQGISGNRVLHNMIGSNAQARFDRDVLSWPNVTHVVLLMGINDIGFSEIPAGAFGPDIDSTAVTADEIIAGYKQIIARAHAHGIKVIGGTLTPYIGASYATEEGEAKRQAVNAFIRNSGAFDGVIDFDAAVRDPENPEKMLPNLHSGDWLHPNDAGYEAMAAAIDLSLFD